MNVFDLVDNNNDNNNDKSKSETNINKLDTPKLFDMGVFISNLKNKTQYDNFNRLIYSDNITAYDIAITCNRQVTYKLLNYPIRSYESAWLPVLFRSTMGIAIHDFIQSNYDFDQIEAQIIIPEYKFYGKVDAINGNNVLIEIKTVPFSDYKNILDTNSPRPKDLKQTLIYKYLLENHIDKIDTSKSNLKIQEYKFQYIQFIYIAHDLISADIESISQQLQLVNHLKKNIFKYELSNHPDKRFFFMNTITIDLSDDNISRELQIIENELSQKLNDILTNYHKSTLSENVDTSQCFFCPYKHICEYTNLK